MDMRALAKKKKLSAKEAAAYEAHLQAEDLGLETPAFAPDELLAMGAPALFKGISKAIATGALEKVVGNEIGGAAFGKVLLKDEITNKTIANKELLKTGTQAAKRVILKVDGRAVPTDTVIKGDATVPSLLSDLIKNRR